MSIFQIVILILIALIIYKGFRRWVQQQISGWLLALWSILWLLVALINVFPEILSRISDFVGIGRGVDLLIYLAIFAIFYSLFRMQVRMNLLDKKLTKVVRKNAVGEVKVKEDNPNQKNTN